MKFEIPNYVDMLLNKLEDEGFEAYIVGGSVRDILLDKKPSDYDITTNASPENIEEIFKDYRIISLGKEFGTVVIVQDEGNVEITTYRIEAEYIDGRRPSIVSFSNDLEEDLKRRDFTINAMAYSRRTGLVDPFGGVNDLKQKKIKTVGDPKERFLEDHLRILRAIRFSTVLSFEIEDNTLKALSEMGSFLNEISAERIREELFKILLSTKPSYGIKLLYDLNILKIIIPELIATVGFNQHNPHHEFDVFNHIVCVVDKTAPLIELRLAALFHDIAKPSTFTMDEQGIGHFYGHQDVGLDISRRILKRLRVSNSIIDTVDILIKEHMTHHNDYSKKGLKRLINRVGKDKIYYLLNLQKADIKCTNSGRDISFMIEREQEVKNIIEENEPMEKKQLAINGSDIVNLGYKQGRIIGEILDYLLERVLDEPELNRRETLRRLVLDRFKI